MTAGKDRQAVDTESFDYLRHVLQQRAGIALSENKTELLTSRLRTHIHLLQLDSLKAYCDFLKTLPNHHQEWQNFLNCLTTNKTDFFREAEHFDYLIQAVLPRWLKRRTKSPWHIWSVPCSSGEEPYSLAMVLEEARQNFDFDYRIAASDIDSSVLSVAVNGVYRRSRLAEIPLRHQQSALNFGKDGIEDWMSIKPHLRAKISFKHCNLIAPPYPWNHGFDVIFCRNLLIYFSSATIHQVMTHLYRVANPGAYLFIGHTETLMHQSTAWQCVGPSIYLKNEE